MILIGQSSVRRHWLADPAKAQNSRWVAAQHFDENLHQIRGALLGPVESRKFEQGVASLLFLLGFSPVVSVEKDAPDLIVITPGNQLVLVECTTRIADFSSKVGKLVDRRGSLTKTLTSSRHQSEVLAVLICALERDQIATSNEALQTQKVLLLTREDLIDGLDRVRHYAEPDTWVSAALNKVKLQSQKHFLGS